jgi:hypothetical protein
MSEHDIAARIPAYKPQYPDVAKTTLRRLLKLDNCARPGLSSAAFRRLFVKCRRCKTVMTRRVKGQHVCKFDQVIDLTSDEENVIDLTADTDSD